MLGKLKFKAALAEGILDNVESNIFIGDNKLNVFMQGIEGLLTDETVTTAHIDASQEEITTVEKPSAESETAVLYDDDDVKQTTLAKEPVQQEMFNTQPAHTGQQLTQSLTKKDEVSGQTYLQIPVENEVAVKNAVGLLAALFKGFSGK